MFKASDTQGTLSKTLACLIVRKNQSWKGKAIKNLPMLYFEYVPKPEGMDVLRSNI